MDGERGGAGAAGDVGGAGDATAGGGAVKPSQREVPHRAAGRGVDDARRLAGDERLVVDDGQQRGLDQGRGNPRRAELKQRGQWADRRSLGDGVDVAAETQVAQMVEEGDVV